MSERCSNVPRQGPLPVGCISRAARFLTNSFVRLRNPTPSMPASSSSSLSRKTFLSAGGPSAGTPVTAGGWQRGGRFVGVGESYSGRMCAICLFGRFERTDCSRGACLGVRHSIVHRATVGLKTSTTENNVRWCEYRMCPVSCRCLEWGHATKHRRQHVRPTVPCSNSQQVGTLLPANVPIHQPVQASSETFEEARTGPPSKSLTSTSIWRPMSDMTTKTPSSRLPSRAMATVPNQ